MKSIAKPWCATLCIVLGLLLAGTAFSSLRKEGKLQNNPNFLTLKGSPYGRIIAYAMRGPADVFWHRGQTEALAFQEDAAAREKRLSLDEHLPTGDAATTLLSEIKKLKTEHEEEEAEEHAELKQAAPQKAFTGIRPYLVEKIEGFRKNYYTRSNKFGDTKPHLSYIRSEAEKRLLLSYQMDPSNIICYGSYFLFLSESQSRVFGAKNEEEIIHYRQEIARKLAENTVFYCMNYTDEATAMITAGSAAHDYLQILYSRPTQDLQDVERMIGFLDTGLDRFASIRNEMIENGTWENYPIHRINEMESAYAILRLTRGADHQQFEKLRGAVPEK